MNGLHFNSDLSECTFTVVDIETTGMATDANSCIVEIAGVRINPPLVVDMPGAYVSLINPGKPIDPAAINVHGITDEMVQDAPKEKEVMQEFAKFLEGSAFIAHNASFDYKFVAGSLKYHYIKSPINYVIDTLAISRKLMPGLKSHSLDSLVEYYSLETPRIGGARHRALYDADLTALLFIKQIAQLEDLGIFTLGDLYAFLESGRSMY